MPKLACWSCGRQIYAVAPIDSLFAEERRCPRCGAFLNVDRRDNERRLQNRRENPQDDPGPPDPLKELQNRRENPQDDPGPPDPLKERRVEDRRKVRRRGSQNQLDDDSWME